MGIKMKFLLGISIVLLVILLITIILIVVCCVDHKNFVNDKPTITFNQFKGLYKIAPKKWDTDRDWYVVYNGDYKEILYFKTWLDEIRYKHWYRRKEKSDIQQRLNECNLKLLDCWQNDLNQYRANYLKELKELQKRANDTDRYDKKMLIEELTKCLRYYQMRKEG